MNVFTGAGISVGPPAALPAGNRLRDEILATCFSAAQSFDPGLAADTLDDLKRHNPKLEFVVGRLEGTMGKLALDAVATLVVEVPNEAHMLAAALLFLDGGIHMTLNFDEGLERAIELLGGEPLPPGAHPRFEASLREWRNAVPACPVVTARDPAELASWSRDRRRPALLKLHGSLVRDEAGATVVGHAVVTEDVELAFLSPPQLAALDELVDTRELIVTGYSGLDIDCWDPLVARLKLPGRVTWVAPWVEPREVSPALAACGVRIRHEPAVPALRDLPQLASLPAWPDEAHGMPWAQRYADWEGRALRGGREAVAEAFAWYLLDARRYKAAVSILESIRAQAIVGPPRGASRRRIRRFLGLDPPLVRVQLRLADAFFERNDAGDRRRSRRLLTGVAFSLHPPRGIRHYAIVRWGEYFRGQAISSRGLRRLASWWMAVILPLAAIPITFADGSGRTGRARAVSAVGHAILRIAEGVAPRCVSGRFGRAVLATLSGVAARSLHRGLRTSSKSHIAAGNRSVFLAQQAAEAEALVAIAKRRLPSPSIHTSLERVRTAYGRIPDVRGVGNADAALALYAAAIGDRNEANRLLDQALNRYNRPDGTVDLSGEALVERRRMLFARL